MHFITIIYDRMRKVKLTNGERYFLRAITLSILVFLSVFHNSVFAQDSQEDKWRKTIFPWIGDAQQFAQTRPQLAWQYLDSARAYVDSVNWNEGKLRCDLVKALIWSYGKQKEASLLLCDSIDREIEKSTLPGFIVRSLKLRGGILGRLGRNSESIFCYQKALDSAWVYQDTNAAQRILTNMAHAYYDVGADDKSLECYLQCRSLIIARHQEDQLPYVDQGLIGIYNRQGEYEKAREIAAQASEGFIRLNQPCGAVMIEMMMVGGYIDSKQLELGRLHGVKALEMAKEYNCGPSLFYIYYVLGGLEHSAKNWLEAKRYFLLALSGGKQVSFNLTNSILIELSGTYSKVGDYKAARTCLDSAGVRVKSTSSLVHFKSYYAAEGEYFRALGQWEEALENFDQMNGYADSLRNEERNALMDEMRVKHDMAQLEAREEALNLNLKMTQQEKELTEQQLTIQNGLLLVLSIGFFAAVVLFLLILNHRRNKNYRQKQQLQQQLNRAQINPHFFFNVLNSIQAQINRNQDKKTLVQTVANFARLMRLTLESSFNDFVPVEEEVERLQYYLELQALRFKESVSYSVDNQCGTDLFIPSQLIQPLVENAIEHGLIDTAHPGELTIRFEKIAEKCIRVVVENECSEAEQQTVSQNEQKENKAARAHQPRALEIIAHRLRLFGDSKRYYFELKREKQHTQAIIYCPFR